MNLHDVPLPFPYEQAKEYWLVFSGSLAERLQELRAQYGSPKCVLVPLELTDGRFALCADVLSEIAPGGLLAAMWEAADKAVLFASVDVLPWREVTALMPPET
jgi:hypothetical protein